jgi:heme exporter protein A
VSAIEARGLTCSRGDSRLFRDVSFHLVPGECLAVRGANGSGKTTLLRCVAGLTRPDAGEILWNGKPVREVSRDFRAAMIYGGHAPGIKDELTAAENLRDALALRGTAPEDAVIDEALANVGLGKHRRIPARRLSAGQRRRIGMARLALDPASGWILDEPLTALDADGESMFGKLLESHLQRGGWALVATHHDIGTSQPREMRLSP